MQLLPNGHFFVGWGAKPYVTEFSRAGEMLFDARWHRGLDSYRAYRFPWTGQPTTGPRSRCGPRATATRIVYASWNGATEVASWRMLAGADA